MECILCPSSIGKCNVVHCNKGYISGMRCPFYQQDGQYVQVENLLTSKIFIDTKLIPYIPNIQKDFEVMGNCRWSCTLWPTVREKDYACILQDTTGKKYTVEDVITRYKTVTENEDDKTRAFESGESIKSDGQLYYQ